VADLHLTDTELDRLAELLAPRLAADCAPAPHLDRSAVVKVPVLLSVAHVAEVLDCSSRTVRRRIDAGDLPAVIEHGRTMVRGDELHRYMESSRAPGSTGTAAPSHEIRGRAL
jgi:excisionase family DNA binding protein